MKYGSTPPAAKPVLTMLTGPVAVVKVYSATLLAMSLSLSNRAALMSLHTSAVLLLSPRLPAYVAAPARVEASASAAPANPFMIVFMQFLRVGMGGVS